MPSSFQGPISAFLADKTLSIPLGQVLLFTLLMTLCMLFGRHKLGLLISYSFFFFWGFIFNRSYFVDLLGNTARGNLGCRHDICCVSSQERCCSFLGCSHNRCLACSQDCLPFFSPGKATQSNPTK